MSQQTLISAHDLLALLAARTPVVLLDCGFDLADPGAGERAYAAGHLPNAIYAHLDRDLAGARTGLNGRHPLPSRPAMAATMGRWGITPGVQVVCYDDHGGVYAARAWWLLRWMGHGEAAVLDGGRAAWREAGGALVSAPAAQRPASPYPTASAALSTIDSGTLMAGVPGLKLLDARAPERFRGEVEPIDPVAGRVPGSLNRFFKENLAPDGRFKPAARLRAEFEAQLAGAAAAHSCGSGVAACHNLLAMVHAGMDAGALYAGSWSEWCSDPSRPVARG